MAREGKMFFPRFLTPSPAFVLKQLNRQYFTHEQNSLLSVPRTLTQTDYIALLQTTKT